MLREGDGRKGEARQSMMNLTTEMKREEGEEDDSKVEGYQEASDEDEQDEKEEESFFDAPEVGKS